MTESESLVKVLMTLRGYEANRIHEANVFLRYFHVHIKNVLMYCLKFMVNQILCLVPKQTK